MDRSEAKWEGCMGLSRPIQGLFVSSHQDMPSLSVIHPHSLPRLYRKQINCRNRSFDLTFCESGRSELLFTVRFEDDLYGVTPKRVTCTAGKAIRSLTRETAWHFHQSCREKDKRSNTVKQLRRQKQNKCLHWCQLACWLTYFSNCVPQCKVHQEWRGFPQLESIYWASETRKSLSLKKQCVFSLSNKLLFQSCSSGDR